MKFVDAVLLRIKNFFPDICGICEKEYCVKISDNDFLACTACGQEAHKECYMKVLNDNCRLSKTETDKVSIINIPGFHFLCNSCEEEITLKTKGTKQKQTLLVPVVHENQSPDFSPNGTIDIASSLESTETAEDVHLHINPNLVISSNDFSSIKEQGMDECNTYENVSWQNENYSINGNN